MHTVTSHGRGAAPMGMLGCAGELAAVSMSRLEAVCREQDAKWLHRLSLGIDDEEVRSISRSCRQLHL